MMDTQNSTLRINTPHSGFPHSNTLSFECGVLSIRHKFGASKYINGMMEISKQEVQLIEMDILKIWRYQDMHSIVKCY